MFIIQSIADEMGLSFQDVENEMEIIVRSFIFLMCYYIIRYRVY